MAQAASDPMLLATDLAELLVRKGVPFRDAHEVVGRIVGHCTRNQVDLRTLSRAELRSFHPRLRRKRRRAPRPRAQRREPEPRGWHGPGPGRRGARGGGDRGGRRARGARRTAAGATGPRTRRSGAQGREGSREGARGSTHARAAAGGWQRGVAWRTLLASRVHRAPRSLGPLARLDASAIGGYTVRLRSLWPAEATIAGRTRRQNRRRHRRRAPDRFRDEAPNRDESE